MDERTKTIDSIVRNQAAGEQWAWAAVQAAYDAGVAAEREQWKQAAEAMAQEADHKFTMDGTTAHWLRALVAKRWA